MATSAYVNSAIGFLQELAACLDELGIAFCLGGSWASTLHGLPRQTLDVDLIVRLAANDVAPLVAAFTRRGWYASETAALEAIAGKRAFNVIAPTIGMKADLFVLGDRPFDRAEFERRSSRHIVEDSGLELPVKSAEDTVLRKLLWFDATQRTSERQWLDVLGVLRVRRGELDEAYLDRWSEQLGITELLDRARADARN